MTEEESYQRVLEEMKVTPPSGGLWLKAIAHSNGDENSAKAKYMLFRAEQIRAESRKRKIADTGTAVTAGAKFFGAYTVAIILFVISLPMIAGSLFALGFGIFSLGRDVNSGEGAFMLVAGIAGLVIGAVCLRGFYRIRRRLRRAVEGTGTEARENSTPK